MLALLGPVFVVIVAIIGVFVIGIGWWHVINALFGVKGK